MSYLSRSIACLIGLVALAAPLPAIGSYVTIFEVNSAVDIILFGDDGARALYDALDIPAVHSPPQCPGEDACLPAQDTKTVSRGETLFYCFVYTDPPFQGVSTCYLDGHFGAQSISFDLSGDAATATAHALEVLGNPYQSNDGFVTFSCDSTTHCQVQGNAITAYWLDYNHFLFDEHEYHSYGRPVLKPFFVHDSAQAFYDALNVSEQVVGSHAIKQLDAGGLHVTCYRSLGPEVVYTCYWDAPVQDGPLRWPVDVRSALDGDAASALYDALDLPGPIKEFHTGDGLYSDEDLYSIVCTPSHCDLRIRRPPLN
jgi:hypothetical protein